MGSELSPEVLAIHQWIRDDAPVTIQMTITPKLISALAERLQLARAEGPHPEQIAENANCSSPGQLLAESASYPGPAESVSYSQAEFDECGQIGERDGYERAVADIDRLTGGDGEFYVSTVPGRGCSDVETMKARIVERFNQRPGESGEWVMVPRQPSYKLVSDLAHEWAYSIEEASESYQGFLDVVSRHGAAGSDPAAYEADRLADEEGEV